MKTEDQQFNEILAVGIKKGNMMNIFTEGMRHCSPPDADKLRRPHWLITNWYRRFLGIHRECIRGRFAYSHFRQGFQSARKHRPYFLPELDKNCTQVLFAFARLVILPLVSIRKTKKKIFCRRSLIGFWVPTVWDAQYLDWSPHFSVSIVLLDHGRLSGWVIFTKEPNLCF